MTICTHCRGAGQIEKALPPPPPITLEAAPVDTALEPLTTKEPCPECRGIGRKILLLQAQRAIPEHEYGWLKERGAVEQAIDAELVQSLAAALTKHRLPRRIVLGPDEGEGRSCYVIRHALAVVAGPQTTITLEQQLREREAAGLLAAANAAHGKGRRYAALEGDCGHAIAASLHEIARELERQAEALLALPPMEIRPS